MSTKFPVAPTELSLRSIAARAQRERRTIELRLADERLAATTRDYYRFCLGTYAYRFIAGMAVGDIRADDILAVVDAVAKDAPTTADRVQIAISSVLTWAVRERIIAVNPARGLP